MDCSRYLKEVEMALQRAGKPGIAQAARVKRYMNSELDFLGLTVPQQRTVHQKGFSFTGLKPEAVLDVWDAIWQRSNCYEVMSQALFYYENPRNCRDFSSVWSVLRRWVDRLENWGHSDTLSGIYARFLEQYPREVYPMLKEWNRSAHPWKRRQSVVSLFYYYRARAKVLPASKITPLLKRLLRDGHYYVQKGVGWTLREFGQAHPREAREFLHRHALELHPAAYTAAVEKYPAAEKARLALLRRRARLAR